MSTARSFHAARLTRREALLFEAGVKLGGVFHQYLGMPVARSTVADTARTIERAVALQPFVVRVRVRIDPRAGGPVGKGPFAYAYLRAEMLDVTVRLRDGPDEVEARLAHRPDLRYPLMRVVHAGPARTRRVTRRARRAART
jgi:dihydroneopterin aldolase